ncbi:adenosylcobinamide-GDP ribazoletransferase [Salipiger sp. IMCC34102]|nr:adenosylcobinamide-GDP ribazoletransferase [Salipiger sp. IMCC34102]RYH02027.1 adenosylcobinamide-GDP ribazoletransferase [Salipiger sp. IMCC34102]
MAIFDDDTRPDWTDLPAAVGFLTRLPVPVDGDRATSRGAAGAWAWPLAGALVGALGAAAAALMLWLGCPVGVAALVLVATQIAVTGALHEDGLADSLDGLWGGHDTARRLEIMSDSRIGAYGVIGLVLSLLLRWQIWVLLIGTGTLWPAAIAVGAISRAPMTVVMAGLRNAKRGGVSHHVGRPKGPTAALACAVAAIVALLLGWAAPVAAAMVVAVTFVWARIAQARIGGQTGDILGATQQWAEITVLLVLSARV